MKIKKIALLGIIVSFFTSVFLFSPPVDAYVNVKGYTRKDGTYVAPHVRSNPNGVKYDNYSYNPNQGLYNKTYGTKDIEWDTPTYITDPDYYIGKQLYENNNSGSSYYNSLPIISTPTCQTNATYSYLSGECLCNYGYKKNSYGSCVSNENYCQNIYGYGTTADSTGNCQCMPGYLYSENTSRCVDIQTYCTLKYGTRGSFNPKTNSCDFCEVGFHVKDGYCYADTPTCASNAHLDTNHRCSCNNGYTLDSNLHCVLKQTPVFEGSTIEKSNTQQYVQPKSLTLRIRESTKLGARVIGIASSDTIYEVIEDSELDWVKIKFISKTQEKEGWVAKRYVQYR